jgi:hypothetical protein
VTRWNIIASVVFAAAAFAAAPASSHHIPARAKNLTQLERQQVRALAHYQGAWRSWWAVEQAATRSARFLALPQPWKRRYRICKAVNVRASWRACQHATLMKRTRVELERTRRLLRMTLPYTEDFSTAVRVAQRPFPGTSWFLFGTADDESSRGHCVVYGGSPCYVGYAAGYDGRPNLRSGKVAGNLQYTPGTFAGHYRHALDSLRSRGFLTPDALPTDPGSYAAWFHPMAQALAAGWACWSDNADSHWSASGHYC